MNIGLPGAGIGGLYYLICTAVMPVKELILTLKNPEHKYRSRLVITQFSIATGIVAGLILAFQLITNLVGLSIAVPDDTDTAVFYSLLPLAISLGLLVVILAMVELFAYIAKRSSD